MTDTELKQRLYNLNYSLGVAESRLVEAKKLDGKRKELLEMLAESEQVLSFLQTRHNDLKTLNTVIGNEEVSFKKRRLKFLDGVITEQMRYIFPRKKLRAEIYCNFDRRKPKLRLDIIDAKGRKRPSSKTEGLLNQQLISFAAAYGCAKLLNKNKLYLDEPLSASSEDNLLKLQTLLSKFVKEGYQIVLVSQSPLLFADIERRVIFLRSRDGNVVDRVEYQNVDHVGGE